MAEFISSLHLLPLFIPASSSWRLGRVRPAGWTRSLQALWTLVLDQFELTGCRLFSSRKVTRPRLLEQHQQVGGHAGRSHTLLSFHWCVWAPLSCLSSWLWLLSGAHPPSPQILTQQNPTTIPPPWKPDRTSIRSSSPRLPGEEERRRPPRPPSSWKEGNQGGQNPASTIHTSLPLLTASHLRFGQKNVVLARSPGSWAACPYVSHDRRPVESQKPAGGPSEPPRTFSPPTSVQHGPKPRRAPPHAKNTGCVFQRLSRRPEVLGPEAAAREQLLGRSGCSGYSSFRCFWRQALKAPCLLWMLLNKQTRILVSDAGTGGQKHPPGGAGPVWLQSSQSDAPLAFLCRRGRALTRSALLHACEPNVDSTRTWISRPGTTMSGGSSF